MGAVAAKYLVVILCIKPGSTWRVDAARWSPYNQIGESESCTKEVGHTASLVLWLNAGTGVVGVIIVS